MAMRIDSVAIEQLSSGSLDCSDIEGVRHIKALPFLSVVQALGGSYGINIGGGPEYFTGGGGIFVAPANVRQTITHHIDAATGRMRARWVFLGATVNGRYPLDLVFSFPTLIPVPLLPGVSAAMDGVCGSEDICDRMSAAYQLIKLLLRTAQEKPVRRLDEVAAVLSYMEKNYREDITVAQLAAMAYMSEPGLYSAFRSATGKSPIAYLNDYRLSQASLLLKTTGLSVKKIAAESGFGDPLYFSRMFKRRYAMSPREYRNTRAI